jgi:hypothetical protein
MQTGVLLTRSGVVGRAYLIPWRQDGDLVLCCLMQVVPTTHLSQSTAVHYLEQRLGPSHVAVSLVQALLVGVQGIFHRKDGLKVFSLPQNPQGLTLAR